MEYKKENNLIYLRVDKDEELLTTIKEVCRLENKTGYFQGIGACSQIVIGIFLGGDKGYQDFEYNGILEIISLSGNTTVDEHGNIEIHSHGVFSYLDENNTIKVTGGHIKSATIGFTGEIILNLTENKITKKYNPELGIKIWDL